MKWSNLAFCTTAAAVALLGYPRDSRSSDAFRPLDHTTPRASSERLPAACDSLLALVQAPARGFHLGLSPMDRAAIEADQSCAAVLEPALQDASGRVRLQAAAALSIIGGPEAVEVLLREFNRTGDPWVKSHLVTAMGSLGRAADTQYLIGALEGETVGNTAWPPIERAALTLGLLRSVNARSALAATASKGGIAGGAAQEALSWLGRAPCRTSPASGISIREGAILAVLQCGVPRTSEGSRFYEADSERIWELKGGKWSVRPASAGAAEQLPSIDFEVHASPDGSRAIVAVGMTFGSRNGSGYSYTLEQTAGEWTVRTLGSTWIS